MKLIESTRSTSPSASSVWAWAARRSTIGANGAERVKAARQASLAMVGARVRYGIDQPSDRGLQRLVEVAAVPDQPEVPVRAQHARELAERRRVGEPVKRLAGHDRVDLAVAQWQGFGLARADVGGRRGALERRAHPGDRLDRDHAQTALEQRARQLAGAGADVQHPRARSFGQPEPFDQPVDRGRRILRPAALVALTGRLETPRCRMQPHAGIVSGLRPGGALPVSCRLDRVSADRLGGAGAGKACTLLVYRVLPVSAADGSGHQGVDPATPVDPRRCDCRVGSRPAGVESE